MNKLFNQNWKANLAAALFTADWKPSAEHRYYEAVDSGYKLTVTGSKEGDDYEWGYTAIKDGVPYPVHGRDDVDSIIAHKVTEEITIGEFLKDGKVVAFYRRNLSSDGQTLTVTVGGIDNEGKPYFNVIDYGTN